MRLFHPRPPAHLVLLQTSRPGPLLLCTGSLYSYALLIHSEDCIFLKQKFWGQFTSCTDIMKCQGHADTQEKSDLQQSCPLPTATAEPGHTWEQQAKYASYLHQIPFLNSVWTSNKALETVQFYLLELIISVSSSHQWVSWFQPG